MANKKILLGMLVLVLALFGFSGCISTIEWQKMDLNANLGQSRLLNLQNMTPDTELYRQAEEMTSRFFDVRDEEYGFFTIDLGFERGFHPSYSIYLMVNSFTMYVLGLLGFPVDADKFTLTAYLNIFDSNGDLVQSLKKTDSFVQTAGFYYGLNPTKKAEKVYSKMYEALFEEANLRSREINNALQAAGPVTIEKTASARTKITAFQTTLVIVKM